jgi:hypothetical protein
VAEFLFRKATTEGAQCVTAAIFWMKTRGGWREAPQTHEIAVNKYDQRPTRNWWPASGNSTLRHRKLGLLASQIGLRNPASLCRHAGDEETRSSLGKDLEMVSEFARPLTLNAPKRCVADKRRAVASQEHPDLVPLLQGGRRDRSPNAALVGFSAPVWMWTRNFFIWPSSFRYDRHSP